LLFNRDSASLPLTFDWIGMQENKHWEDSFQVYERGVALFKYPHVKDIWNAYLAQFVKRYGGSKLERARDLFRHALEMVRYNAVILSRLPEDAYPQQMRVLDNAGHLLRGTITAALSVCARRLAEAAEQWV